MESLNLHTLANSLPIAQQNAEKELSNNFKAAALSITTLYRSSRKNSKRAYNAGYAVACQDLLTMIQQGVSLNGAASSHPEEGGMTIGRIMDWTEARLEAIKSREEEEDEEEEREKEKEGGRSKPPATATAPPKPDNKVVKVASASTSRPKDQPASLPTPNSPRSSQPPNRLPSEPSSPSPPPPSTLRPIQRPIRHRASGKGELAASYTTAAAGNIDFINDGLSPVSPSSTSFSDISIPIAAGAKRRHAMMMMLDSSASPVAIGSSSAPHPSTGGVNSANGGNHGSGAVSSRRRTRSSRNTAHQQAQNQNLGLTQTASDAMDVEEEGGRERKRVARR